MVVAQQTAQALAALDMAVGVRPSATCINQGVVQALVRPFGMIMGDEFVTGAPQLSLAEENQSPQALSLD